MDTLPNQLPNESLDHYNGRLRAIENHKKEYQLKHGDTKEQFKTGAQRDTQEGKKRYDLIPVNILDELAAAFERDPVTPNGVVVIALSNKDARADLLPLTILERDAALYGKGAKHYGDDNWKKGIPFKRVYASALRHLIAIRKGQTDEDHVAALRFNAACLGWYQEQIEEGNLPDYLNDFDEG